MLKYVTKTTRMNVYCMYNVTRRIVCAEQIHSNSLLSICTVGWLEPLISMMSTWTFQQDFDHTVYAWNYYVLSLPLNNALNSFFETGWKFIEATGMWTLVNEAVDQLWATDVCVLNRPALHVYCYYYY